MTYLPPHQKHSDTSFAAAVDIRADAHTLRLLVLAHIAQCSVRGATDEELQHALQMAGNTERPRRVELEQAGYVFDSGKRRKTVSGRMAVVWVLTNDGKFICGL